MRILIPVLTLCLVALAQEGAERPTESLKGVVAKNLAPVSTEVLRVKLPRPAERKMKNGLPVLIIENHRVPTVELTLVIPASTLSDPAGLPGVAEATANMLNQGTEKRNSRQIAEELSELGASLSVSTSYGSRTTRLAASALVENLDSLLELVADLLLHASFPQDELEKWKARKLSSLQQNRTSPPFLANERLYEALYPGDARALTAATPESVQKLRRQHLLDFYKGHYRPANSLLGVTGDVKPDVIMAKLEKTLGPWESGAATEPKLPLREPVAEKKIYLVNRPNSVQTYLLLANRAIDRLDPDYVACMVMNRVLGAGPAGRLFRNLREDKGYTYGAGSNFAALKYLNHFTASSSVRTEVTGPAVEEFLREFRDIRDKPVPKEELDNARRAIVAGFALSLENQGNVLNQILLQREYGLPSDYWDTYPEKVMAVTAADVQRVARKYVPVDNVQLVAVGDANKIRELLQKHGPLEEYDSDGKRK